MIWLQVCGYSVQIASRIVLILWLLTAVRSTAAEPARDIETSLLHRRLDLRGVRAFDSSKNKWGSFKIEDRRLFLVHIWAVECKPCVAEMPILKSIARGWKADPSVQVVFISETIDAKLLHEFWFQTARDRVPDVPLTQSTDERIRDVLETGKQPLTLLLDRDLVVRQAFVGPLTERTTELTEAMSRLLRAVRVQR